MLFHETRSKQGFELPIKVENAGVFWERIPTIKKRFSHTLDVLDIRNSAVLRMYSGSHEDGSNVGEFHMIASEVGGERYIILPPRGITMRKDKGSGAVKSLQDISAEVARRNKARLCALIDQSKNCVSVMEDIEKAGYVRSGVNMRVNLIVLNFGGDPSLMPLFAARKFTICPR